ncbi:glycosyltransferase family 32 protein [Mucor ambiguus]|uniref:Glycosyltransferase family 32 protein n=1 Tax=Mucor ambiguus TaxID=91626 RepID=A0A0C9MH08_9FUNG|nr:glycosyltransferase family 32 protein [Mucor ambiguus]
MQCLNITKQKLKQTANWISQNKRIVINLVKYGIVSVFLVAISFFMLCRLEVNAHVYLRNWLSPPQPVVVEPLSKCFSNLPPDSPYYQGNQKFSANFVPGLPVWEAHTCYDFAALFKPQRYPHNGDQLFHTYWSSNLTREFEEKQVATLRSFSATQNTNHTLIVWIPAEDEDHLTKSESWNYLTRSQQKRDRIVYKVVQPNILVKDTAIEPFVDTWQSLVHDGNDGKGRDDLLRMLVLYRYGGLWFDMDTMFVRDLAPLFEHEWIAQGSCSTGMFGNPFTGALFHFHQGSPYVCEILEGAADLFKARVQVEKRLSEPPKRYLVTGPEIFGSKLYYRIYRRVLHHGIKPWSILPWCFTDPSQCRRSNSLPSLFSNSDFDEKRVRQTFAYHWRDRWTASPGTIFKFLDSLHKKRTNW